MKHKNFSGRRSFIKKSALGAGLLSSLGSLELFSQSQKLHSSMSDALHLKMAGYDYQRVSALFEKKVGIEGCTFEIEKSGIGEMNTTAFDGPQTYDVSEIGIVPFILAYGNQEFRDYYLLPVFPLRMFRHKSIFIRTGGPIRSPKDLKGKKIGTTGYSTSSLTWIRGMMQDEYGISPMDVEWVLAKKDSSADVGGKASKQEQVLPEGLKMSYGTPGMDESDLLLNGEVDALFHAVQPKAFVKGDPKVGRLFSDSRKVEQEYYAKTGIFPIMHAVAVRKTLLDEEPGLAESLFKAYSEAKTMNYNYMNKLGWAYDTLPWYGQEHEDTKRAMGTNFWPYGMDANRKTLETICRYCFEQGFIKKEINYEDMFFPGSMTFSE